MRMIPPQLVSKSSAAERRLFEELSRLEAPTEVCCLHSLELPDHLYKMVGELDFVIVSPRGLYVLEVKGGGVSCRQGVWYFEDRWGDEHRSAEGPFHQARSGMYSLLGRMKGRVPGPDLEQLVAGYGVVFPDCDFDVHGLEWPQEIVLDARLWRSRGVGEYLKVLESYWHGKKPQAPARLGADVVKRFVQVLRPEFELVRSPGVQAEEIEARMERLTEDQYRTLDLIQETPRILIEGGAGTGKTFLAVEMARRHTRDGRRVLFLCFSPLLANGLAAQNRIAGVEFQSVHGLMLDVVRGHGGVPDGYRADRPLTDQWYQEVLVPAFERTAKSLGAAEQYDVLIIDEGQDVLNLSYLAALGHMLRGGLEHGTWRIFYDRFNQGAIFGAADPEVLELLRECATLTPGTLKTNCRNTTQIVTQTKLLTGADPGVSSTGPGPNVEIRLYENPEEATQLLQAHLEELARREVQGKHITILSPKPFAESCAARLRDPWRKRLTVLDGPDAPRPPYSGLTYATVADFKGLENRFIALVDVEDLDSTPVALATLYVGMTRARVGLWVAAHESVEERQRDLITKNLALVVGEARRG